MPGDKKMKALRLEKIGALALTEIPVPDEAGGTALVKVSHCAVCRTDAKMWRIGHRDLRLPRVLGHEICGVLTATGRRVVVWPGRACGCCRACRTGAENLCSAMRITGFHEDGGFAEYVRAPESSLLAVPENLPGEIAALAEPLACAVNAVAQLGVADGESVLIFGAGPVGLLAAVAVRARGARPFIHEIHPERRRQTRPFCRMIEAPARPEVGVDAAINAAPSTAAFTEGLSALKSGGRFCLFSGLTDGRSVPAAVLNEIHYRQLRVSGAYGCTRGQMACALDILSDFRQAAEWLIEARIPLSAVPSVLPRIAEGRAMKMIVTF
jgi:threonine dehydrogenase-like Zn-dependent dehydrogenase